MQNLFTVLKVAGLVALVALAVITRRGDASHFVPLASGPVLDAAC